jgi:hypothetical protein
MPATSRTSVRARLGVVLALLLGTAGLVAVSSGAVASTYDRATARQWAGYPIARTGSASGGWIGGYRIGRVPAFVTTPTKRPNRRGYRAARLVRDLDGRRGASRAETTRAAWILSKYGGYRDDTQAAAVDASTYHLLAGGRWRISGSQGSRRVSQSGDPATVRRFVKIMLRQSRDSAGVYRARIRAGSADVGGTVTVTVRVTDGGRQPAPGLPVTVAFQGADPVSAVTGDDGRAVARFPADGAGWHKVTARVGQVPDHRLHLRRPVRRGQASAAEAGRRRTIVATARAAVRGPQTLSITASPRTLTVGEEARVVATVTGDGSRRTASATLHGPFASAGTAECSGSVVETVSTTVREDGDYTLPAVVMKASGYYVWRVAVEGTATSLRKSACGADVTAKASTTTAVTVQDTALPEALVRASMSVSGLPSGAEAEMTITVAGPFTSADVGDCGQDVVWSDTMTQPGDGSVTTGAASLDQPGYYLWQARTAPGALWKGSSSTCGASGTVTHVS